MGNPQEVQQSYQQQPPQQGANYYQQQQQPQQGTNYYQQQQPQQYPDQQYQQQPQQQQSQTKSRGAGSNCLGGFFNAIVFGAGASIGNMIVRSICS